MAKSLHFVSVALLFTACAFVSMPVTGYESGTHEFHRFDRMKAIEQLLLAFYPALGEHIGQLTFEVEELNLRPGGERETPIYVNFADCHVGSGVPAGGQPRFRYCPVPAGSPPLTDYLLSARVDTDTRLPSKFTSTGRTARL
jgi:hypothetical protein